MKISIRSILISFLVSCLIFVFVGEITARLFLTWKRKSWNGVLYGITQEKKRLVGVKGNNGGADYYKSTPSQEARNPVNRHGFRGTEIKPKRKGTLRVICLGGSTTYGDGLDYLDTFPAILQRKLNEKLGGHYIEIINAGQPGMDLSQIVSFTKREICGLDPDVVVLMSIENNFVAPGFWFAGIKGGKQEQKTIFTVKLFIIQRFALGFVINDVIKNYRITGFGNYIKRFDWKAFSAALSAPHNIWATDYEKNLKTFCETLYMNNQKIKILFLEEAFNFINHPEMTLPFEKATAIFRKISESNTNCQTLDVCKALLNAAQRGEPVWQSPAYDPTHLSPRGNEIIADLLAVHLSSMFLQSDKNNHFLQ